MSSFELIKNISNQLNIAMNKYLKNKTNVKSRNCNNFCNNVIMSKNKKELHFKNLSCDNTRQNSVRTEKNSFYKNNETKKYNIMMNKINSQKKIKNKSNSNDKSLDRTNFLFENFCFEIDEGINRTKYYGKKNINENKLTLQNLNNLYYKRFTSVNNDIINSYERENDNKDDINELIIKEFVNEIFTQYYSRKLNPLITCNDYYNPKQLSNTYIKYNRKQKLKYYKEIINNKKKNNKQKTISYSINNISNNINVNKQIFRIDYIISTGVMKGKDRVNQDSYFIKENQTLKYKNNPIFYTLIGVCDGHGNNGSSISNYISLILPNQLISNFNLTENLNLYEENNLLISAIEKSYSNLIKKLFSFQNFDFSLSGSTNCTLIITNKSIISINIGNSRAILGRLNKKINKIIPIELTKDHNLNIKSEKERILKMGGRIDKLIDSNGKKIGPLRSFKNNFNIPGLVITRSIGDKIANEIGVINNPEIKYFNLCNEDKFIFVGTDGIFEFISNEECVKIINEFYRFNDTQGALKELNSIAKRRWIQNEGIVDDITGLLVFFK